MISLLSLKSESLHQSDIRNRLQKRLDDGDFSNLFSCSYKCGCFCNLFCQISQTHTYCCCHVLLTMHWAEFLI